jgi:hypothetical protein
MDNYDYVVVHEYTHEENGVTATHQKIYLCSTYEEAVTKRHDIIQLDDYTNVKIIEIDFNTDEEQSNHTQDLPSFTIQTGFDPNETIDALDGGASSPVTD